MKKTIPLPKVELMFEAPAPVQKTKEEQAVDAAYRRKLLDMKELVKEVGMRRASMLLRKTEEDILKLLNTLDKDR